MVNAAADKLDAGKPADPLEHLSPTRRFFIRLFLALSDFQRRLLGVAFVIIGPRAAYAFTSVMARLLYRLVTPLHRLGEAQIRAAMGDRLDDPSITRLAERSFVHRMWNLADLSLADRLLHPGTFRRYVEDISPEHLQRLRAAMARRQPAVMITAYYGPFDLLPIVLAFNGIHTGIVYLPHRNERFDRFRHRIRSRGGSELVPVSRAAARCEAILDAGGMVAIVADHHAERRGMPVTFLGLPTMALRSVGLLACRYDADLVVAGIRRKDEAFRFRLVITDIVDHSEWREEADPVGFVTERYLRGLERLILDEPSQYLWFHPRWGKAFAKDLLTPRQSSSPTTGAPEEAATRPSPPGRG